MADGSTMVGQTILLVVDTRVAIKFVTQEAGSDAAYRFVVDPEPLIAPDWLLVESATAL